MRAVEHGRASGASDGPTVGCAAEAWSRGNLWVCVARCCAYRWREAIRVAISPTKTRLRDDQANTAVEFQSRIPHQTCLAIERLFAVACIGSHQFAYAHVTIDPRLQANLVH